MRRAHILKGAKAHSLPLRMVWVDTESDHDPQLPRTEFQTLKLGVATYHHYSNSQALPPRTVDNLRFTDSGDFWDWVIARTLPGRAIWVMAHNWNYDAAILSTETELLARGWANTRYINGKPPLIVRWSKGGASILMVDTLNYFSTSVESLGVGMGVGKLRMPPDDAPGAPISEAWWTYAERDVEIIRLAFLAFRRFVADNGLGKFQVTLASQAMTAFRKRFMARDIYIHSDPLALLMEREGYHGGRTDAFWRGAVSGPLYKLDVNSMYPAIMRDYPLPYRLERSFTRYYSSWWDRARAEGAAIVARCVVNTDEPCYAYLDKSAERLLFPVGQFEATLTTPEIDYALERGHIQSIGAFATYERDILFRQYVEFCVESRQRYRAEENEAFSLMAKLMSNSLYGRWAMAGRRWETSDDLFWAHATYEGIMERVVDGVVEVVEVRNRLGVTQEKKTDAESDNSFPMIAAEISSRARMLLWGYICEAGEGNTYYCDTDSVVVNQTGYDRLAHHLHPTELGKLKIEKVAASGDFRAPKHYYLDSSPTIKGVRRRASIGVPISRGSRHPGLLEYKQAMFRSWDYNITQERDGLVEVVPLIKVLQESNTKRIVRGDGPTAPIEM